MTPGDHHAIVISGCGWVTPMAAGPLADVLVASNLKPINTQSKDPYQSVPDQFRDEFPDFPSEIKHDKGAWMAALALVHACRGAGLDAASLGSCNAGMVLGIALAGQLGMVQFAGEVRSQSARFVTPLHFPQTVGNYTAGALSRAYNLRGPNVTLASGKASGLDAVIEGHALLVRHRADLIFAGATERLSAELAQGLAETDAVLAEGACLFVLERTNDARKRGARVLATITNSSRHASLGDTMQTVDDLVLSAANAAKAGVISIEHWVGCCFGGLGAAAIAAAIGAVQGLPVPVRCIDGSGGVETTCRPRAANAMPDSNPVPAIAFADSDDNHRSTLHLAVEQQS